MAWLALVLGSWTIVHALNRGIPIVTDATPPCLALLFWTSAKVCAWLLPTAWWTWRHARTAALAWLGLCSSHGLGLALIGSAAWLALQAGGLHLGLAVFRRPPPDLVPEHLLAALLVAPVFEELMFRGAMLRALRERGVRRELVVLATALAFAALHVPGWLSHRGADPAIVGSFMTISAFGVVLGYLGWMAGSLWAPLMLHFANNLLSTGTLEWLVRHAG